jgi:hypothetical protein
VYSVLLTSAADDGAKSYEGASPLLSGSTTDG